MLVDVYTRVPQGDALAGAEVALRRRLTPLLVCARRIGVALIATVHPWYLEDSNEAVRARPVDSCEGERLEWIHAEGVSAFYGSSLAERLATHGVRNVIFGGLPTETTVHSTMRDANDRGFECLLLEDGTAASNEEAQQTIVRTTRFGNGLFGATATIAAALQSMEHAR